nr:hypothetical protein [Tanacetum cinerariifolium]
MRIDELHKFSDGTLIDVRTALDDRLKGIRMKYLPEKSDKDREAAMIQATDKRLKTRRIMRSLERSILTDLQVTPTKPGRMTKPYSFYRFIANCFNAGNFKMEVKVTKGEGNDGVEVSCVHHCHNVTPPPAAFSTSPPSTPQHYDHPPLPANNTTIIPPSLTEATSTAAACHRRHHSQPLPYSTTPPTPQHCHHHHPRHHLTAITLVAPPSCHHHQHRHDPIDTAGSVLDMSQTTQGAFGVWFCSHGCVWYKKIARDVWIWIYTDLGFAPGVFGFEFSGNRAVRFGRLHP